jgi:hypothetical protein
MFLCRNVYTCPFPSNGYTYDIKMNLREIGWVGIDWVFVAEDRDHWRVLGNTVMNLWVP